MKKSGLFLFFLFLSALVNAQTINQTVKGRVSDKVSGAALSGANIRITGMENNTIVASDENGNFSVSIPVGRYQLIGTFTGYEPYVSELLVISAHESVLTIQLQQNVTVLSEVEVSGSAPVDNDVPGLRSLPIEKTLRIPANFLDPVRVATAYPGVVAASDQSNSIIVHGNSPNGLLWRLNGLDIVNPNHLANAGTLSDRPVSNGGGVNILSAQMLDRTDFYLGALPVNYGNALAGVIDMNLRDGNNNRHQYTAQASLIGLDFAAEGPLNKKQTNSFLVNYRYSTVGILSAMGVDFGGEAITFQDFSFHTSFNSKKGGKVTLFGFGGFSKNEFNAKDSLEREEDKDWYDIDFEATTYALGATYDLPLNNGAKFSAGVSFSSAQQERQSTLQRNNGPYSIDDYFSKRDLGSAYIRYSKRVGEKSFLETGANISYLSDDLRSRTNPLVNVFGPTPCSDCFQTIAGTVSGLLLQPYFSLRMAFSSKAGMVAGFRYVNFTYNKKSNNAEPRISFYYHPTSRSSFDLAYSHVSQFQLPTTYLTEGNQFLGLTKAHHINLSYKQVIAENLKLSSLFYYQSLYDVPVGLLADSYFSTINLMENDAHSYLIQDGTGQNYGIDALIEKSFYNQSYFSVGGSYYNSTYTTMDNKTYDSRFNGQYTFAGVYGKEWSKASKNRTIGFNTRVMYLGGMKENAIDEGASEAAFETVYDNSMPYSVKLKDYVRLDMRISFRKNKPRYTRTFAIDIQNLLGTENEAYHRYEFSQNKVITKFQLGIIPVIVYRIDF